MIWMVSDSLIYLQCRQAIQKAWSGIVSTLSTNTNLVISGAKPKSSVKNLNRSKNVRTTSKPSKVAPGAKNAITAFMVSLKFLMEKLLSKAKP